MARRFSHLFADTRPLESPDFRRLWLANIVTVIGAQLTVVAVPAQIYADTGSSAYVGLSGVFGLVPLIIFGLYGGALADVFDRRTLLIITTLGLIITSALFWAQAAVGSTNVWLLLSLFALQQAFFAKGKEFERVLKMGRTHLQDAVPMSLGQEFHGWGTTIGEEVQRIAEVRQFLHEINLGATAIGTTVTAAPGYPELSTKYLSELTGRQLSLIHI